MSALYDALSRLVREMTGTMWLYGSYSYQVTRTGDAVTLTPTLPSLPAISDVSHLPGLAGSHAVLTPGSRVLVQFVDASPDKPIVTHYAGYGEVGWKPVSMLLDAVTKIEIGPTCPSVELGTMAVRGVARIGDTVQCGPFPGVITMGSTQVKAGG